jgi:hypothetical protein
MIVSPQGNEVPRNVVDELLDGFRAKVKDCIDLFKRELAGANSPHNLGGQVVCLVYMAYDQALATNESSPVVQVVRVELKRELRQLGLDSEKLSSGLRELIEELGGAPAPGKLAASIARSWTITTGNDRNMNVFRWAIKVYVAVYLEILGILDSPEVREA